VKINYRIVFSANVRLDSRQQCLWNTANWTTLTYLVEISTTVTHRNKDIHTVHYHYHKLVHKNRNHYLCNSNTHFSLGTMVLKSMYVIVVYSVVKWKMCTIALPKCPHQFCCIILLSIIIPSASKNNVANIWSERLFNSFFSYYNACGPIYKEATYPTLLSMS